MVAPVDTRQKVIAFAARPLCAALIVLGGMELAGCSAATPAPVPVYYASPPVPNPQRVRRPATATPASAGGTTPAAAPEGQLPADAQPPTELAPPGGLPHDSSEYIEPPSR